ncbi:hypothetical protein [Streptomyces sulphureus]|uniref:hypothetical protein n=1 Tax=Streptomyces sulphureus TaxID=47758 RepID=UPI000376475D|nr:hypothetical protein [Streptomyces sulphureus]
MSAISLSLLCAAAGATALGCATVYTAYAVRDLRRQVASLHTRLDEALRTEPSVPEARDGHAHQIRAAVSEALAQERERELAEARAFWAAREARCVDEGETLEGHGTEYVVAPGVPEYDGLRDDEEPFDGELFIPRQSGPEGPCPADDLPSLDGLWSPLPDEDARADGTTVFGASEPLPSEEAAAPRDDAGAQTPSEPDEQSAADPALASAESEEALDAEPPELAAARRRHPSNRDYDLRGDAVRAEPAPHAPAPAVGEHQRTVERLAELACARTPLTDVRPGPLGTLDVYVFEDGTTVCLSPGHRETSERLAAALDRGEEPYLLGGSSISGAYALTFAFGEDGTAYLLADRVIASL